MSRYEIRYAAIGGQGIITAATLLVAIAVEKENKHAGIGSGFDPVFSPIWGMLSGNHIYTSRPNSP